MGIWAIDLTVTIRANSVVWRGRFEDLVADITDGVNLEFVVQIQPREYCRQGGRNFFAIKQISGEFREYEVKCKEDEATCPKRDVMFRVKECNKDDDAPNVGHAMGYIIGFF